MWRYLIKEFFKLKELKQLENYYKNNEIDIDGIIEDFTPYIYKNNK